MANEEERQRFESDLRRKRPDLVNNPAGVREVMRWFDGQIKELILKYPFDYERYGKDFLVYHNQLARYIGDKEKSFDDYRGPARS